MQLVLDSKPFIWSRSALHTAGAAEVLRQEPCAGPETGAMRMHLACPARVHRLSSAHTEPPLLLKCRF